MSGAARRRRKTTSNEAVTHPRRGAESEVRSHSAKSERIGMRAAPGTKALLRRAAACTNKSVTEFLLEAGVNAAQETLCDRRTFPLDDAQWRALIEILDRRAKRKPRLAKLLAEGDAPD